MKINKMEFLSFQKSDEKHKMKSLSFIPLPTPPPPPLGEVTYQWLVHILQQHPSALQEHCLLEKEPNQRPKTAPSNMSLPEL